ncbi:hypothetical protein C0J52_02437, partial [Blattella germanica]
WNNIDSKEYLGSLITEDNKVSEEIKRRIKKGNKCYWSLQKLMKSKNVSSNAKIKIYRTVNKPVVMYTAETWCLLKDDERRIAASERKILIRIYRPKLVRWAGHVDRSEENSLNKEV